MIENQNAGSAGGQQTPQQAGTGKAFDKDTVFECIQDCQYKGVRRRKGDRIAGRQCPLFFVPIPEPDEKPEELEGE